MTDPLQQQLRDALGVAYTITRELSGGGMSRVFLAEEVALNRRVVVKVLPPETAAVMSIERFRREIALAARLQHPHIVPLLTAGEAQGLPYFTMPFVEGESLRARLARHGELPLAEAIRLLREVASALQYAHERGVVHRDIKPDNVLLSGGSAMVTDFGIAKAISASSQDEGTPTHSGHTSLGVALGTPTYMSPEQASADPAVDHRADLYAFGVLAYEALTGQPPFAGRTPQGLLAAHITETPESIQTRRANLPSGLAMLVMRCLEKRPADRPQTAAEIVHALDEVTTPSGGTAPLTPPPAVAATAATAATRRLQWKWIAGGIGIAAIAMLAIVLLQRHGAAPTLTTVAVFPFENASGDTSMAYFADGMTDELSAALGDAGLKIVGRASVLAVQSKHLSDQEAGKALGAGMILHGRVARSVDRLRVWTQLVSAADGAAIATKTYDTTMSDVFAVQDGLAHAIAAALRPSVSSSPAVTPQHSGHGTDDVQAYELFLKGNYYVDRQHPELAIASYKEAIARDPKFARAVAGAAVAYTVLASAGTAGSDTAYARVREFASRALALDSLSAAAHSAWAFVLSNDLRFNEALAEQKRASDLDPDNTEYLGDYAGALAAVGRVEEANQIIRRALALDPLSVQSMVDAQYFNYMLGRYDSATAFAHHALELDPTSGLSWSNLLSVYSATHKPDSALAASRNWYALGKTYGSADFLVLSYALAGHWSEAAALRDSLRKNPGDNSPSLSRMLIDFAYADFDDAMTALETGFDHREPVFASLVVSCDPMFDYLKPNPRFAKLMDRYGIKACPAKNVWPVAKPPR